jgi:hypothetical protein
MRCPICKTWRPLVYSSDYVSEPQPCICVITNRLIQREATTQNMRLRSVTPSPSSQEQIGYADPLDASRGWGYIARDHGAFGSYPVHDDFGDESRP